MTGAAKKLLDEALALSDDERTELAAALISSLDEPADADWEAAWATELERRRTAPDATSQEWPAARAEILAAIESR